MIKSFFKGFKCGVYVAGFVIGFGVAVDICNAVKNMKVEINKGETEETPGEPEPPKESEDEYEPSYAD